MCGTAAFRKTLPFRWMRKVRQSSDYIQPKPLYNLGMRLYHLAAFGLVGALASGVEAQGLLAKPGVQHATVVASTSAAAVSAGSVVTLWADVTPNPSIHIYAEGAKDFTPVSIVLTPDQRVSAGQPKYPKPEVATAPGATEAVPAYKKTFRIALPVTVKPAARAGDVLNIAGAVKYQACDDRLCYPVTAVPVSWNVTVK